MGIIRGGLLVIVSVLLLVSIFASLFLLTMSWSLNYSNVKSNLGEVIKSSLTEQININKLVADNYPEMQVYCNNHSSYNVSYDDLTVDIPCSVISQGSEVVVDYAINQSIEKIYFKQYDCKFWDCFSEEKVPFFLVSQKAQSYWYSKFNYVLMIIGVLSILGFVLAKKKSNFFILISALIIIAAIPFSKLGWVVSLLGDSAETFLSIFFSKGYLVFIRGILVGIVLLVIGIILKLFGVGFKIQAIFSRKEAKEKMKEEVKKEVAKTKSQPEEKQKKQESNKKDSK